MSNVKLLDSNTINKIAAGEVISRPSSVVKELVENAIDAAATAITIEIKDGGIGFIRITDNGTGIDKEDAKVAFLRHATSKIRSIEDLFTVSSLGFRGEALSSVAAVAQVELITKTADVLTGIRYCIEGGKEGKCEEIGCPDGTTFIIRNLFYNTPARRKFLKTAMTEAGYINDLIQRMALSHPEISFKFINNNQNRIHTSGNMRLKDIIYSIFGRDIAGNLLKVELSDANMHISGYIGKPLIARGNRGFENYFINGRYIKSNIITKAIEEAYKTFIMVHRYPFTALHLEVPTSLIDVNVHPAKLEVRFHQREAVYQLVYNAVREALIGKELIPEVKLHNQPDPQKELVKEPIKEKIPEPFEKRRLEIPPMVHEYDKYNVDTILDSPNETVDSNRPIITKSRQESLFSDKLLSEEARIKHQLIGQIFDTYWLVEYDGKLFIIDQHAAHEKVLYEKIMTSIHHKKLSSQYINPPIIITLSMREEELIKKYSENFKELAFEIEHFGGNEYAVRAIPTDLYGIGVKDLLLELIDLLSAEINQLKSDTINDKIATMACKAAVKGNNRLSFKEADALIDQLLGTENPYTCPHGRPTIISLTKYELEKKFKRIQ